MDAKRLREDEFYTQLADIERELRHYKKHFKGKVVYCNCDDPRVSNFFHYFSYNFEKLGLKKLITTCYKSQNADLFSQNDSEQAIYLEYEGDKDDNNVPDPERDRHQAAQGRRRLPQRGEHRAAQAGGHRGDQPAVLALPRVRGAARWSTTRSSSSSGNQNAISYKEIFRLIKDNKLWLGYNNGDMEFMVPDHYDATRLGSGWTRTARSGGAWATPAGSPTSTSRKRHEDLILYKTYNPEDYPTYDNYDAIEVSKVVGYPGGLRRRHGRADHVPRQVQP